MDVTLTTEEVVAIAEEAKGYQERISELESENRQLKRALWLARANRAYWQARTLEGIEYASQAKKWYNVNKKCRSKAEEFLIKEQK